MIKSQFVKDYLEASFKKFWDYPLFTDLGGETYKYSDVAKYIAKLHILFQQLSVPRGAHIALIGKNSSAWTMTYLAIVSYGAVIVPILNDFHPREVHNIVNHSDSILLFSSNNKLKELDAEQMPGLKAVFAIDPLEVKYSRMEKDLSQIIENLDEFFSQKYPQGFGPEHLEFADVPNSEVVEISYTSGSTGMSKGVMLTGNNLAANIDFANRHMELNPGDHLLSILPLAHSFGCAFEFLWPINRGTHIFFLKRKPTPTILLDAYKQVRPHLILSVPLIFEKIYKNKVLPVIRKKSVKTLLSVPIVRGLILKKIRNSLIEALGGRFREVVLGGAPLNNEVEQFFRKIKFPFTVGYGMTECGPLISYASWKITKPGSCGKLVDTLEAKVLWQQPDLGEICVRGENVMKGYYKSPELTAQAIDKDGWLHTGDLGYIDEENFIFLKGRSKSLLLGPSGENIFPEEIEALYLNQPYVEEVLVVMRDNKLVAMIYPDLKLMEKNNVSWEQLPEIFEQLRRKINQQLPHFKRIARIEIRKEEFEKTPKRSIKRYLYQ